MCVKFVCLSCYEIICLAAEVMYFFRLRQAKYILSSRKKNRFIIFFFYFSLVRCKIQLHSRISFRLFIGNSLKFLRGMCLSLGESGRNIFLFMKITHIFTRNWASSWKWDFYSSLVLYSFKREFFLLLLMGRCGWRWMSFFASLSSQTSFHSVIVSGGFLRSFSIKIHKEERRNAHYS